MILPLLHSFRKWSTLVVEALFQWASALTYSAMPWDKDNYNDRRLQRLLHSESPDGQILTTSIGKAVFLCQDLSIIQEEIAISGGVTPELLCVACKYYGAAQGVIKFLASQLAEALSLKQELMDFSEADIKDLVRVSGPEYLQPNSSGPGNVGAVIDSLLYFNCSAKVIKFIANRLPPAQPQKEFRFPGLDTFRRGGVDADVMYLIEKLCLLWPQLEVMDFFGQERFSEDGFVQFARTLLQSRSIKEVTLSMPLIRPSNSVAVNVPAMLESLSFHHTGSSFCSIEKLQIDATRYDLNAQRDGFLPVDGSLDWISHLPALKRLNYRGIHTGMWDHPDLATNSKDQPERIFSAIPAVLNAGNIQHLTIETETEYLHHSEHVDEITGEPGIGVFEGLDPTDLDPMTAVPIAGHFPALAALKTNKSLVELVIKGALPIHAAMYKDYLLYILQTHNTTLQRVEIEEDSFICNPQRIVDANGHFHDVPGPFPTCARAGGSAAYLAFLNRCGRGLVLSAEENLSPGLLPLLLANVEKLARDDETSWVTKARYWMLAETVGVWAGSSFVGKTQSRARKRKHKGPEKPCMVCGLWHFTVECWEIPENADMRPEGWVSRLSKKQFSGRNKRSKKVLGYFSKLFAGKGLKK